MVEEVQQVQQQMLVPVMEGKRKTDKIDKMETEEMVEEGAIEMEEPILKVETILISKTKLPKAGFLGNKKIKIKISYVAL